MDRCKIEEYNLVVKAERDSVCMILQLVDERDLPEIEIQWQEIKRRTSVPFFYAACGVKDWNRELSPWKAEPVFGKEGFAGEAADLSLAITDKVVPELKKSYGLSEDIYVVLGGYSLAGLFSLWAAGKTDSFSAVMAASPSVWYPEWMEYAKKYPPLSGRVYLSLGDAEDRTRNRSLSTVGTVIKAQYELLKSTYGEENCILEWNAGNHFTDVYERCAKGFAWCMESDF